ncbi:MAG: GNAT family N-acetyltransferase [Oscillospiraceae bacterium]
MELPIRKKAAVQTKRLPLKPYSQKDTALLVELLSDREVTRTFMVPVFETAEQTTALAQKLISFSRLEDTRHLEYGIYLGARPIGFITDYGGEGDEIEIGYVIHPEQQAHGYATEAVGAVIEALREMGFRKVRAGFFTENTASRRVMEKCGMKPNGVTSEETYCGILHPCRHYEICFQAEPHT